MRTSSPRLVRRLAAVIVAVTALSIAGVARAALLADSIDAAGDSITRAYNADSCTYGDQPEHSFSPGDDHGSSFCTAGPDGVYSHAERLECAKGSNITVLNDASSGATMRASFASQATTARSNLGSLPGPRYLTVFLGHNDACTNTTSKTGNSCSGDQNPNNYCRTTNAAFEREFRQGMDQLIQIPSSRILVAALVRVSELCNFGSKSSCGLGFGSSCSFFWQNLTTVFGGSGVCRSLTNDCSTTRRIDMYDTIVAYNEILERVSAEYAAIPAGGTSATGAVKAADVGIRYAQSPFVYKFQSSDISCCDCFHPADAGQRILAEALWSGAQCSPSAPCCAPSSDPLVNASCSVADTTSFYPGGFWAGNPCGNGLVDPSEQCDLGAQNGAPGTCCTATCTFASGGVCRTATGPCDVAETCSGTSATCPADALAPGDTVCRPSGGVCDIAETCTGVDGACPADDKRNTVCRPALGPCDVAEFCDGVGNACPADAFVPSSTVCRGAAGVCDVAENCTGSSAACPGDTKSTAVCRPAAGECDVAETCDGVSVTCPADAKSTAVCRAAAGVCDVAESCDGGSDACPADTRVTAGTQCRPSAGVCDVAETCDGASATCPADAFAAATVTCRAAAGVCDLTESCTGSGASCPSDAKSSAPCRPSAGVCDVAETCDGSSNACPADALVTSGTVCRASAGVCDVAETCTGSTASCPADAFEPAAVVCRAAAGQCDIAEHCSGADAACPADVLVADDTACDDGDGCTAPDRCVAGTCSGTLPTCGDGEVQPCAEQCDDGNATSGDGCSNCTVDGTAGCRAAPQAGCRAPVVAGGSSLIMKGDAFSTRYSLVWKWSKGAATARADFGDPLTTTSYRLCLYDASPGLVAGAQTPAGGICAGRPCWKPSSRGFTYADKEASPDGVIKVILREGVTPGTAKVQVKGKGALLALPTMPLALPVTAQLQNSTGECWEAVYAPPAITNTSTRFKDKSQ